MLKPSSRPLGITSRTAKKIHFKKQKESLEEKYFSSSIVLTDFISLSGCL